MCVEVDVNVQHTFWALLLLTVVPVRSRSRGPPLADLGTWGIGKVHSHSPTPTVKGWMFGELNYRNPWSVVVSRTGSLPRRGFSLARYGGFGRYRGQVFLSFTLVQAVESPLEVRSRLMSIGFIIQ